MRATRFVTRSIARRLGFHPGQRAHRCHSLLFILGNRRRDNLSFIQRRQLRQLHDRLGKRGHNFIRARFSPVGRLRMSSAAPHNPTTIFSAGNCRCNFVAR